MPIKISSRRNDEQPMPSLSGQTDKQDKQLADEMRWPTKWLSDCSKCSETMRARLTQFKPFSSISTEGTLRCIAYISSCFSACTTPHEKPSQLTGNQQLIAIHWQQLVFSMATASFLQYRGAGSSVAVTAPNMQKTALGLQWFNWRHIIECDPWSWWSDVPITCGSRSPKLIYVGPG